MRASVSSLQVGGGSVNLSKFAHRNSPTLIKKGEVDP